MDSILPSTCACSILVLKSSGFGGSGRARVTNPHRLIAYPARPVIRVGQATLLEPELRRKVLHWATAADGLLPARRPGEYVRARDSPGDAWDGDGDEGGTEGDQGGAEGGEVRWARLKAPSRCVEKLVRSYRQVIRGPRVRQ